ncbi:hypothetical protein [Granulicella mallensis]|uniref:Uncharacterized protein n=1 Tax=Granulicella mallensis (strain ATCC BAA-1857 / DSM 23137 / MP5ACTX8) TaxID=682795 RepID=G8NV69_GRAMM|nr:hypothetical protein [Granulicella mallensis]AEU35358.1 hypothetical protein AciX8_1011 [Granulicella mallensis MP5ACTX8]
MKIAIWTLVILAALTPVVLYFFQRWRQQKAEREGVAVYATVISVAPMKRFGRTLPIMKIVMWIQEPGSTTSREVTLSSRVEPGQKITAGVRLAVVIDPKNPERIYPAGPEAAKRVVLTGPRRERRQMRKAGYKD